MLLSKSALSRLLLLLTCSSMLSLPSGAQTVLYPDEHETDYQAQTGSQGDADSQSQDDDSGEELPLEPERTIEFELNEGTWLSLDMSPDGETIVFDMLGSLYSIAAGGGTATALTAGMQFDSQPTFSPDGEYLAYVSDGGGSENLWMANADGTDAKQLSESDGNQFTSPVWTPDSQYVIVSRTSWGLRTHELWMYHRDGGAGVQLTEAKASPSTPNNQRLNALGPQVSPDGRYVYYASRRGGFSYNLSIPAWTIARLDLETGDTDTVITAQGSAMRPTLSPDGRFLVYASRFDAETGLRLRNLETGEDDWLLFPVTRDDQESRFTRDLYPASTFTPDSSALITTFDGGIRQVSVPGGEVTSIPFTVSVEQAIGPDLKIEQAIEEGDLRVRLVQSPKLSPDGEEYVFSALGELYVHEIDSGETRLLENAGQQAFHPGWSPDGRDIVYVSWEPAGGHIWKVRATGRGNPDQLTDIAAYYTEPVYTPDGEQIVALRGSNDSYVNRPSDFGPEPTSDLVRLPEDGGDISLIAHAVGMSAPHFAASSERVYVTDAAGLVSMRLDGTDRRTHIQVEGPGIYANEDPVGADEIRISRDGNWALAKTSNQLHVVAIPRVGPDGTEININSPALPYKRITDLGADYFSWSDDGSTLVWAVGSTVFRQAFDSISFGEDEEDEAGDTDADEETGEQDAAPQLREDAAEVLASEIEILVARDDPGGNILLQGARVITMNGDLVIDNGDVLVQGNRIAAVGAGGSLEIPEQTEVINLQGRVLMPGFVDTHGHWSDIRHGIIDNESWVFMINLAYGVTSGLDVQTSTNDMFAYQDMIDAGRMVGIRAFSTGPGVFSDNAFKSYDEAYGVLRRYRDHYRTRNIKAYISGNRKQRQWLVQASRELGMIPTTEGGLDLKLNLTHAIDGFWGTEHALPIVPLYDDVVELVGKTGMAYTPTLLVAYGGPWAENYFYSRSNPHDDPKLSRFTPHNVLDAATRRRPGWFMEEEHVFSRLAEGAAQVMRAGGRIGIGSHGQLQGLGYHWELWALASGGLTPMETLQVATIMGAEVIGFENEIGSIEPGKYADLVVLAADPLEDIYNTNSVSMVMRNGRLYDANTLEELAPGNNPAPSLWFSDNVPQRRASN